ncbi:hypothetical protein M8818_003878 [Zalaria obscura]|uniref:Uncharacterized protein n=1 Tax=Zalaria obscura TaxID=2024903 RepID=A0ACC3SI32_9PEZI
MPCLIHSTADLILRQFWPKVDLPVCAQGNNLRGGPAWDRRLREVRSRSTCRIKTRQPNCNVDLGPGASANPAKLPAFSYERRFACYTFFSRKGARVRRALPTRNFPVDVRELGEMSCLIRGRELKGATPCGIHMGSGDIVWSRLEIDTVTNAFGSLFWLYRSDGTTCMHVVLGFKMETLFRLEREFATTSIPGVGQSHVSIPYCASRNRTDANVERYIKHMLLNPGTRYT